MRTRKPIEQVGVRCRSHQKYVLDEPGRRLILALYDSSTERLDELQRRLCVPRYVVKRWARELGVTCGPGRSHWKPEEVEYLKRRFHKDRAEDIAKHLGCTVEHVRNKAYQLGLCQRHDESYTLAGVCEGLGCYHAKAKRWCDEGWLKGTRRTNHADNDPWTFSPKQIRDFIIAHPEEIDLRRVEKLWFIDILAGGEGIGALDKQQTR
jgi:hypothetical protein